MPRGQTGAIYWQFNSYEHQSIIIYILNQFQMQSVLN